VNYLSSVVVKCYTRGMANHETVPVYVPAEDALALKAEGKDVADWVRALVKHALTKRREMAVSK